jgi:hypothetical protein
MTWLSVKWIALTAAGFVGMSAMAWASVGWQRHAVNELTEQETGLEADIAEMQVNASTLAKKGARSRSTTAVDGFASRSIPTRVKATLIGGERGMQPTVYRR